MRYEMFECRHCRRRIKDHHPAGVEICTDCRCMRCQASGKVGALWWRRSCPRCGGCGLSAEAMSRQRSQAKEPSPTPAPPPRSINQNPNPPPAQRPPMSVLAEQLRAEERFRLDRIEAEEYARELGRIRARAAAAKGQP